MGSSRPTIRDKAPHIMVHVALDREWVKNT